MEIDLITYRLFDEYYPLYVWIITVIIVHLLFIFPKELRLTKKEWIILDYLYYTIATLSLISILYSAEKYFVNMDRKSLTEEGYDTYNVRLLELERRTYSASNLIRQLRNEINGTNEEIVKYENYLITIKNTIKKLKAENEVSKLKNLHIEYDGASNIPSLNMISIDDNYTKQKSIFISETYNDFIKVQNPFLNETNLCNSLLGNKYKYWCTESWVYNSQKLNQRLYHLHESYIEATYLLEKSKGKDLELFLALFAPYLIAFALGIRISKVSAELVGFKREKVALKHNKSLEKEQV